MLVILFVQKLILCLKDLQKVFFFCRDVIKYKDAKIYGNSAKSYGKSTNNL